MTTHHARISPTAKIVAFLRAETDIPYCREIASMCDCETVTDTFFSDNPEQIPIRRALVELRFKSLNAMIRRLRFRQVLEFATGIAPRGLILSEDSSMTVIETDLIDLLEEKRLIVESLISKPQRPNYKLQPANALHIEEVWEAADLFEWRDPITVVHEGLLQYLDLSEKRQLAGNIRDLLDCFGGRWITSDVLVREVFDRFYAGPSRAIVSKVAESTGRSIIENCFPDWDAASSFFAEQGFSVERFKQIDFAPEIRDHISDPQVLERIEYEEIWVMSLISRLS